MKRDPSCPWSLCFVALVFAAGFLSPNGELQAQFSGGSMGMSDLGMLGGGAVDPADRFEPVVRTICDTVEPSSWNEMGGEGSIHAIDHLGVVVVRQTDEVHGQIEQLIAALRQAQREQEAGDGMTPAPEPVKDARPAMTPVESKENAAARKKIEAALSSPTTLEFQETPLEEAAEAIGEKHGIAVMLDRRALEEIGIPTDIQVTRSLKGITLRSALRLMLRDLDLCTTIRDEVLLITSREKADTMFTTRLYRVADLAAPVNK